MSKCKSSITDWIQAITGIVSGFLAAAALIIAWFSLTAEDGKLQGQIDTLSIISRESVEQTKQLKEQIRLKLVEAKPELSLLLDENDNKFLKAYIINSGSLAKNIRYNANPENNLILINKISSIGEGQH